MSMEAFDNLSPLLAMRLRALAAPDLPDTDAMSAEEFAGFWQQSGLKISSKNEKSFLSLIENMEARIRLEEARAKLTPPPAASWLDDAKASIDALPIAEVIRLLKDGLSLAGTGGEVFARKLEETSQEDLRSMLLDLERVKGEHGEAKGDPSPRGSL